MAVDTLFETMRGDVTATDRDSFARRLVDSIEEAGARIFHSAKKDRTRRGMGTTATVAGLVDKVFFVGQVGDSRCYILRDGRLTLLTKDQSLVNQLIEAGQLTQDEAEVFEHSNIILQALGTTEQVVVDLTFVELRRGDRLLLCSDGLSALVQDAAIETEMARVRPLPQLVDSLIDLANAAGGHDNITCIVADFDGEGLDLPEAGEVPFYQQYPLPRGKNGRAASGPALPGVVKSTVPGGMATPRSPLRDRERGTTPKPSDRRSGAPSPRVCRRGGPRRGPGSRGDRGRPALCQRQELRAASSGRGGIAAIATWRLSFRGAGSRWHASGQGHRGGAWAAAGNRAHSAR
jgi:serine/threonine protein phosphatase PrpC